MKKKRCKKSAKPHKRYRLISSGRIFDRNSVDEKYIVDGEQIKNNLARIEKIYYSSNIKLDQIEKRRNSKIILSKVVKMIPSMKKRIKL